MEFNKLKTVLLILFVLLAGVLYSCNNSKQDSDIIVLENPDITQDNKGEQAMETIVSNNNDISGQEQDSSENNDPSQDTELQQKVQTEDRPPLIYIHISGAVNKPGVYEAGKQTRVYELIELAGGLTDEAAGDYINQAAIVMDGQQIYIPSKEEVKEAQFSIPNIPSSQVSISQDKQNNKVNINIASKEELMTLTGIGEAKADSIIEYRQKHGKFNKIEDIMNISGIKEAAFSKISDDITVN